MVLFSYFVYTVISLFPANFVDVLLFGILYFMRLFIGIVYHVLLT
jgi:hypothetical protein